MKPLLSVAAIALTFAAFLPYIVSIRSGRTRPHVFSWLIWGVTTLLVFLAQRAGGAGVGAWPTGVSALITFLIAWLAHAHGADGKITTSDWLFLLGASSALPFWVLTADPLWAVVILTLVDLLGFGPTLRRAYSHPEQERVGFYSLFVLRNLLVLLSLEQLTLTTALFPAAVGLACVGLVLLLLWRRRCPLA
ncbi:MULTISPECIES: hypothetical protein [unclassified Cyanobium]|uniref:hypothetical protein n=1 Tax=unclassified Cyanobium TaxID=2627006 RepID=UPI0020CEFC01|nr:MULTISPECIES: hypothetical protein [unclassified Cyanobium]MCP9833145.1 hypothetical protein [Cyanobium sp. La Preciosa 7G6]MCP9935992.1 hypothetical protein [Cyanobium sp. Aljojuca 7A6]